MTSELKATSGQQAKQQAPQKKIPVNPFNAQFAFPISGHMIHIK
ncbi:hypothetical protein RICGR_0396 [Rickettsiella grylli]|uniref:Uncharacterized protein n=1 Tax=Rickettsiella grylli TaxID=59196 RepID=A8PLD6_9COXI|nr:hypothetical protein RICGR_0396 [Rickettsiella grylli]